jgi:hypothetical protein
VTFLTHGRNIVNKQKEFNTELVFAVPTSISLAQKFVMHQTDTYRVRATSVTIYILHKIVSTEVNTFAFTQNFRAAH